MPLSRMSNAVRKCNIIKFEHIFKSSLRPEDDVTTLEAFAFAATPNSRYSAD